ncbi:hypothetical protein ACWEN3_37670 [Streptomyces sp. NPDC004561]
MSRPRSGAVTAVAVPVAAPTGALLLRDVIARLSQLMEGSVRYAH